ncbi:MAG: hypothetical protein HY314_09575, partial [Acidobacteria bacterium]|nr:hypothetical protein [Acidobacteriota bacterium]
MTRLVSNLRVSMHRTFFVALAGFVLTVWPAFTATAFSAQESKAKTLDSALTQTILSAQESKGKEIDVALTSTAFTYQGQLKDASGPVTGSYDFQFVLYSAQTGGEPLGASEMEDVALSNGMFSLRLDFGRLPAQAGAAADAKEGWLEIGVRPSGSAEAYTVLFPRQKLTPTPYAIFAQHEQWSLIGVPVGFAGGVETATVISDESADQGVTEAKKVSEETAKSSDSGKRKVTDAESQAAAAPQSTAGTIPKFVDANNNLGDS